MDDRLFDSNTEAHALPLTQSALSVCVEGRDGAARVHGADVQCAAYVCGV